MIPVVGGGGAAAAEQVAGQVDGERASAKTADALRGAGQPAS